MYVNVKNEHKAKLNTYDNKVPIKITLCISYRGFRI